VLKDWFPNLSDIGKDRLAEMPPQKFVGHGVGIGWVSAHRIKNSTIIAKNIVCKHNHLVAVVWVNRYQVLIKQLLCCGADEKPVLNRVNLRGSANIVYIGDPLVIAGLDPEALMHRWKDISSFKRGPDFTLNVSIRIFNPCDNAFLIASTDFMLESSSHDGGVAGTGSLDPRLIVNLDRI